jgi:hypothetical protein
MVHHLVVPEAQHTVPTRDEPPVAFRVSNKLAVEAMLPAVDLDDQPM